MFFSQSFLARKGPMGTVWCAAHMQSRLKKSHYTSTHIPSTVDRIMFPEVPLALRMSGHLLIGVVRIYAKQVDILYHDCTNLRKVFTTINLNLPEDARQAPVQTVTLPETFDLDAMDLDDNLNLDGGIDHHLKSQDDITIVDQIPCETETYVCITFDEDILMDYQHPHDSSAQLDDQNVMPPTSENKNEGIPSATNHFAEQGTPHSTYNGNDDALFEDPGPRQSGDNLSDTVPEIEIMRDAGQPSSVHPHILSPNRGDDDIMEPPQSSDQVMSEKEAVSPIVENILPAMEQSPVLTQVSVASLHESLPNISPVSFVIRSTPRVQELELVPIPKPRPRKRKQPYDEAPVLSNKLMKEALKDTRNLVRERKRLPASTLGMWRLKNKLRKEPQFHEPSPTGLCSDLCDIYNDDYVSQNLERLNEAHRPDDKVIIVRSPSPVTVPGVPQDHENTEPRTPTLDDDFQEIEILRDTSAGLDQQNTIPETIPSPIITPSGARNNFSASPSQTFRSISAPITELYTPSACSEENTGRDYSVLSDVPEVDDLFFLEAESSTPAASQGNQGVNSSSVRARSYDQGVYKPASQGNQGVNSLTARTRALAQYLKRQSLTTPSSGEPSEFISLNKLLEGKTRKICARMFIETLVLRSKDLVDAEQEESYGEITLRLSPALSKAQL